MQEALVRKLLDPKPSRRPSAQAVTDELRDLKAKVRSVSAMKGQDSNKVPASVQGTVRCMLFHKPPVYSLPIAAILMLCLSVYSR